MSTTELASDTALRRERLVVVTHDAHCSPTSRSARIDGSLIDCAVVVVDIRRELVHAEMTIGMWINADHGDDDGGGGQERTFTAILLCCCCGDAVDGQTGEHTGPLYIHRVLRPTVKLDIDSPWMFHPSWMEHWQRMRSQCVSHPTASRGCDVE